MSTEKHAIAQSLVRELELKIALEQLLTGQLPEALQLLEELEQAVAAYEAGAPLSLQPRDPINGL